MAHKCVRWAHLASMRLPYTDSVSSRQTLFAVSYGIVQANDKEIHGDVMEMLHLKSMGFYNQIVHGNW
jgi:hypothetical protein